MIEFDTMILPFVLPFYGPHRIIGISPNGALMFKTSPPCCAAGTCYFIDPRPA